MVYSTQVNEKYMVQYNDIPTYSTLSDSLSSYRGLKIGCLNIRGLLGKIDELRFLVLECNFDIMDLCETFLDDNIADHEIIISMLLGETEIWTQGEFYYISRKVELY